MTHQHPAGSGRYSFIAGSNVDRVLAEMAATLEDLATPATALRLAGGAYPAIVSATIETLEALAMLAGERQPTQAAAAAAWSKLRSLICLATAEINDSTPGDFAEPTWWIEMMSTRHCAIYGDRIKQKGITR